jgi:diguanylate cyclase (GGDEF)-like protein/PAS domain S-box-containing protein
LDGEERTWLTLKFPVSDPTGGRFVGGVAVDVTERKRAEEAVRASEARFGALVRNAPDIITILAVDGTIQYESPAIASVVGYDPDELVGTNAFALVHPDDLAHVRILFAEALAQPGVNVSVTFRFRHKDGSWRWLEGIGTNLLGEPSVQGIVVNTRDATDRRRAEEQLAHLAYHDPLTGLPNRTRFMERLSDALARTRRGGEPVAVLFVDLDRFKLVNDSRGHAVGDRLLTKVGQRLQRCLPPSATLSRLGGDEFALLLERLAGPEDAVRFAETLIGALRPPIVLDGKETYVDASIGIALSTQRRSQSGDLLRSADIALYQAKTTGRGTYAIFEPRMLAPVTERLERETSLRRALERDELRLHYQPVIELSTGGVVGLEALVRWNHAHTGPQRPEEFIRLAEETGLIIPLDRWALREACRQARIWQLAESPGIPLVMSVNLSASQLQRQDLAPEVAEALAASGLAPELLELEVTESVAMADEPATRRSLKALKRLGVRLAIDDFGTGYSSLTTLRQLPLDTLKIDGSFVAELGSDPGSQAIVRAVTTLAHDLGLIVTAEGVETTEQAERLQAIGVDRGQGFFFVPPASQDVIGDLLRRAR